MTTFEHPLNGHREEVTPAAGVLAFLFGWFYFVAKGLWPHVLLQLLIVLAAAALTGGPGVIIAIPLWVGYALATPSLLRARYLRAGWRQVA